MKRSMRVAGLVVAGGLALAACGSSTTDDTASATTSTKEASEGVSVEAVWARASPAGVEAGAAYMALTSAADDALVGVSVDSAVAGRAEIHEVVMTDDGMADGAMTDTSMGDDMTDTSMEPTMVMQQIQSLALPAGETVSLCSAAITSCCLISRPH
ncbi:MAG: copper chaperone PCu(A)C [Acidimicrobiales bacterium]